MSTLSEPRTEADVAAVVAAAFQAREPLSIEGGGTKRGMLRPVQAGRSLSTTGLSGITLYAPQELIISALAGTPVSEIERALVAKGQHLIAEPPDLRALLGTVGEQTIGGLVATNLSGPRRITSGAMRDHVMGVRAVDGEGVAFHSGGRVLKNVTGLDLCKLLTGSHGTLGVLTEVTLKVLPAPEATGTVVIENIGAKDGVAALSAALGSPYGVSGAAWIPAGSDMPGVRGPAALVRIEDFTSSVDYRIACLAERLGPYGTIRTLADGESRAVWRAVRDVTMMPVDEGDAVWRVSVRPSRGPDILARTGLRGLLDWGGGLVWLTGDPGQHETVTAAAADAGGTWMLMRAPESLRSSSSVLPPEAAALSDIRRRVKSVMDPAGILNPGRLYPGA